ncbi:MAG TPA: aminotransferase class I/II-fold pyridoxal phosphate-dependent enzyme, partial [Steroidobacteraceae bacterium]
MRLTGSRLLLRTGTSTRFEVAFKCSGRWSWRKDVPCPGHQTVPRLANLTVLSSDGCSSHRPRSCEKDTAGRPDLLGIRKAIETGQLASGARLPSWRDLATQLGVSRGTVRVAYGRLIDEQFVIGLGAAGTRVAERLSLSSTPDWSPEAPPLPELFHDFGTAPLAFQIGVPSQDAFPFKLWSRILTREARRAAATPVGYPDPRGDPDLRKEVAAYLGIARGIRCSPSQVLVTAGFSGALGLAIPGLQLERMGAWMEDPGYPLTRTALWRLSVRSGDGSRSQVGDLTVHVWTPTGSTRDAIHRPIISRYIAAVDVNGVVSTGHAALEMRPELYISHYPAVELTRSPDDFRRMLRATAENDVPGRFLPSYAEEAAGWCESNARITFRNYDPVCLQEFWNSYR